MKKAVILVAGLLSIMFMISATTSVLCQDEDPNYKFWSTDPFSIYTVSISGGTVHGYVAAQSGKNHLWMISISLDTSATLDVIFVNTHTHALSIHYHIVAPAHGQKPVDITITWSPTPVIPEVPLGTLGMSTAFASALALVAFKKKQIE